MEIHQEIFLINGSRYKRITYIWPDAEIYAIDSNGNIIDDVYNSDNSVGDNPSPSQPVTNCHDLETHEDS